MCKAGGERKRRVDKVLLVLGSLQQGLDAMRDLQTTNHGEGRIKHCVKYDLGGGYRWVTVQTNKMTAFCYVGSHEETERWLDRHGGLTLTKGVAGTWEPIYKSPSVDLPICETPLQAQEPAQAHGSVAR